MKYTVYWSFIFAMTVAALTGTVRAQFAQALGEKPAFLKREVTDPLLKIRSGTPNLWPPGDYFYQMNRPAKADFNRKPPVIDHLWGKSGVLVMDRLEHEGGEIDFSTITTNNSGKLHLYIHRHPWGAAQVQVMKAGKIIANKMLNKNFNSWESVTVPFKNEPVRLTMAWHGWAWEMAFVDYSFTQN
jgi:hypothetical protein